MTQDNQIRFDCNRTCPLFEKIDTCRFNPILQELGPVEVNSHVVDVDVEIRDLGAFERACKTLGLTFERNRTTYRWYGTHVGDYPLPKGFTADQMGKCDHAAHRVDGKGYGLGLCKRGSHYRLIFDFYGSGGSQLEETIGHRAKKLTAEYTVEMCISKAQELGWKVERAAGGARIAHPVSGHLTVSAGGQIEAHGFMGNGCHDATKLFTDELGTVAKSQSKIATQKTKQKVRRK